MRLTSTRWPISSVGTIDSLGMRYGLTRNAWIPSASPSATATMSTSSSREPEAVCGFFTALGASRSALGGAARSAFVLGGSVGRIAFGGGLVGGGLRVGRIALGGGFIDGSVGLG